MTSCANKLSSSLAGSSPSNKVHVRVVGIFANDTLEIGSKSAVSLGDVMKLVMRQTSMSYVTDTQGYVCSFEVTHEQAFRSNRTGRSYPAGHYKISDRLSEIETPGMRSNWIYYILDDTGVQVSPQPQVPISECNTMLKNDWRVIWRCVWISSSSSALHDMGCSPSQEILDRMSRRCPLA